MNGANLDHGMTSRRIREKPGTIVAFGSTDPAARLGGGLP